MDVGRWTCPACNTTFEGLSVFDGGLVVIIDAHKLRCEAQLKRREADKLDVQASELDVLARQVRIKAHLLPEQET